MHRDAYEPPPLRVLYEDNHLLGVYKPGGALVQGDRTGDLTLIDQAKQYLKDKYDKPGNVFIGLVHRIDRPASGVVMFARTSKAASRLTNEFRLRRVRKTYLAVVIGRVSKESGELRTFVERTHLKSRTAEAPSHKAKEAILTYRVLAARGDLSLLEVSPQTGRHHQIRLQLAGMGNPVAGDLKYGAEGPLPDKTIALHASKLVVAHPTRDEEIGITARPAKGYPWDTFGATIETLFQ